MENKEFTEMSLEEAKEVINACVRVCFLRDCRASPKYHLAVVNNVGAVVEDPVIVDSEWEFARKIQGYE